MPIGLIAGHSIVYFAVPTFFNNDYSDAVQIFDILLAGWAMTLLSIPWYVALQAGNNPWRFTGLISLIVIFSSIAGWLLIPQYGVMGAAWASVIGCSVMLSVSKLLCGDDELLTDGLAILSVITCYFISIESWLALVGVIIAIPAKNSIDFLLHQYGNSEEE